MGCAGIRGKGGALYRPRRPKETPFYRLVEQCYPQFRAVYPDRYEPRYGFWRPAIGTAVEKFLECGDVHQGFVRVRCPDCASEFFVAFPCRGRCFCPSCHEKRALEKAGWVAEHIGAEVAHRQFVFTMPKRLRIYFRFDRRLLGELCRGARLAVEGLLGNPRAQAPDRACLASYLSFMVISPIQSTAGGAWRSSSMVFR